MRPSAHTRRSREPRSGPEPSLFGPRPPAHVRMYRAVVLGRRGMRTDGQRAHKWVRGARGGDRRAEADVCRSEISGAWRVGVSSSPSASSSGACPVFGALVRLACCGRASPVSVRVSARVAQVSYRSTRRVQWCVQRRAGLVIPGTPAASRETHSKGSVQRRRVSFREPERSPSGRRDLHVRPRSCPRAPQARTFLRLCRVRAAGRAMP